MANQDLPENGPYNSLLNVKCSNNYSVQNDESLCGHFTNERRVRKQDKYVRRDVT